ncbi:MAG: amino acid-binding protein [Bacteroidaceae bacterium]|nr:amino acid-binding protein [Bacteroidaceae bacterium]MBP5323099.1 amino acid-binding protein [Bacteroidaceae bacterium]
MTIHQLSVFIENKSGTLLQVLQSLKEANIQIIASTIADTQEYGIYRIICSQPAKAYLLLKEDGINVVLSEVFAIELDNYPGRAAQAIQLFSSSGISINYMYSFLLHGKGILVFRTNDSEKTREVIANNHLSFVEEEQLNEIAE